MVALVVIWGLNLTFVKIALPVLPPLAFNALRFAGATIVLLVVLRFVEGPQRLDGGEWPGLLALGFVGHSLYQILFISGLALTTAGNSSVILATVPLFVVLLGAAFKVERARVRTWIGIFLAFGGLVLLVSGVADEFLYSAAMTFHFLAHGRKVVANDRPHPFGIQAARERS